jgi:hypothetical protein
MKMKEKTMADEYPAVMTQQAPYPVTLAKLVEGFHYRPGWTCHLVHMVRDRVDPNDNTSAPLAEGLTLDIVTRGYNSYHVDRGQNYGVHHYMIVPAATYNRQSWQRWLLDQHFLVERHETCEFFNVDGDKPFAPHHGPGSDPYIVFDHGTDEDRRTSFRGIVQTQ